MGVADGVITGVGETWILGDIVGTGVGEAEDPGILGIKEGDGVITLDETSAELLVVAAMGVQASRMKLKITARGRIHAVFTKAMSTR